MCCSLVYIACFFLLLSSSNGSNEKEVCGKNEKPLALLDMAEDLVSKAKLHYPTCSNDSKDINRSNCADKVKSLTYLEFTKKLIKEAKESLSICASCDHETRERPRDCSDILANGHNRSGVYTIYPISRYTVARSVDVYCDMDSDGGGWTVIQRRGKFPPQQNFNRGWQEYKIGFGNITKEFWLGNDNIYALSNQGPCEIRFDLRDAKGNRHFAVYKNFRIEDENSSYTLRVSGYNGNAGDGFAFHDGKNFSTKDRGYTQAANHLHGASWHMEWAYVHLNGIFQPGVDEPKSIHWWAWLKNVGLAFTEMKVRLR